jgi:uncharacterized repeat protein (TIGR02543 family)
MKKALYVLLAALTIIGMVSCGGGDSSSSGGGEKVDITFDQNYSGAPAATVVKVGKKAALGSLYPATVPVQEGYIFLEWNSETEGTGNFINGNTKFSKNTTVYAIWATQGTKLKVTFDYNYTGAAPATIVKLGDSANVLDSFPGTPGRQGYTFQGWFTQATGGDRFTKASVVTEEQTVFARWAANGAKPTLDSDVARFEYQDASWQDVVVDLGVDTFATIKGKVARQVDIWDEAHAFKGWANGATPMADTDVIATGAVTYTAQWNNGAVTADTTGAEKVYGENSSGYIVFGFTISGNDNIDLTKIKGLKADYLLSEAAMAASNLVPHRAFGPYFFNGTADPIVTGSGATERTFYGDFMIDAKGALVARFDGTASTPKNFNKFHSYMCYSGGGVLDGSENSATPAANTWFTTAFNFDPDPDGVTAPGSGKYSYGKTLRLLEGILTDGKEDGVQILPAGTTATKTVYFAIGISRRWAGEGKGKNGQQSPWEAGVISYIKNVKMIYDAVGDDDSNDFIEVNGTAPDLTAGSKSGITQMFAGYVDPVNFGYRGAPSANVAIPADPTYVAPPAFTPALSSYTVKAPSVTLYQNDEGKTDARKRVTINGNVITFDLQAGDYNNGADNGFGGGGFKILFDDIDLPEAYRNYRTIVLDTTITETSSGSAAGKQVIFSGTAGTDVTTIVNNDTAPARYVDVVAGANEFKFAPSALPGTTDGFAVRTNNWDTGNVPFQCTLTINRITFFID